MKKFLLIIYLSFNLYAIDLSNSSFVDFVRFVSNVTHKNFIIDENVKNNISVIIPNDFKPIYSFKILKSILLKNDLFLSKTGENIFILIKWFFYYLIKCYLF